jgi:phage-related protein
LSRRNRAKKRRGQASTQEPATPRGGGPWLYWQAAAGSRRVAQDELDALGGDAKGRLLAVIKRYREGRTNRSDLRPLGDGLWELRTRIGNDHYRVIFFRWGDCSVALTVFYKNQQRTPPPDIKRAADRRRRWLQAFGEQPPSRQK